MKIATFNINGINGRLPVLLRWLEEQQPDVVCLQELKAPAHKFPQRELSKLGYNAVWHGQKMWNGVAILARGIQLQEVRNTLPGDADDDHSRYIEAIAGRMLVCCLYLPNGNPAPGPKFDYKLAWFKRLKKHAKYLLSEQVPVVLAGDYNVIPTERDVYKPERWEEKLYISHRPVKPIKSWSVRDGPTQSVTFIRMKGFILSGIICATPTAGTRAFGWTIFCSVHK